AGRGVVPVPATPTDYEKDIARMHTAEFLTANCVVRRQAMQAIGGFDERFTAAWREDSDLQFRLLRNFGTVVALPAAIVEHPVRAPEGWFHNLKQHRKIVFDALLYKKHPQMYRERIRRSPPWHYYAIVLGALVALFWPIWQPAVKWVGFAAWFLLTAAFCARRLRGTSRSPRHVLQMVVTSIAIPFVAVYWRLAGALRFRVFFL
ncbi:MAG TPA: glycosyltransferase family 2 protein, partial [Usitatibacter sp.]|nr:glycosyltransferase family 2 protein [Usitatibacter sp.]